MAHLYRRDRSPFWWISYRDPRSGELRRESTGLRIGRGTDTKAAQNIVAERTLAESKSVGASKDEQWARWVPEWLKLRRAPTARRYLTGWGNVSKFLRELRVDMPRQLTRSHCLSYLAWRKKASHNTAMTELRLLSRVMAEAVRRGFATNNPATRLGFKLSRGTEKPEFSDEILAEIETAIAKEEEPVRTFLANSFAIARYQGCRLSETLLNPMADVDLAQRRIRFRIKGDRDHIAPLHPKLVPLFERLIREGKTATYELPKRNASLIWFDFLKKIGIKAKLPGACFHSLRVTAVTRLARAPNVSESRACRFIGHASHLIHRTYQRLRAEDLGDCLDALS